MQSLIFKNELLFGSFWDSYSQQILNIQISVPNRGRYRAVGNFPEIKSIRIVKGVKERCSQVLL